MRKKILYLLILQLILILIPSCQKPGEIQEVLKIQDHTKIIEMTTNDLTNPLGIDGNPYFSWKMESSVPGQKQTSYQIVVNKVDRTTENEESEDFQIIHNKKTGDTEMGDADRSLPVWDSGKITSSQSVAIPYTGSALESGEIYTWQVKVWDKKEELIISDAALFEMGKKEADWQHGNWIKSPGREPFGAEKDKYMQQIGEISYDFTMERTHTGFLWGAVEGQYGKYYRCSFDASGDYVNLLIAHMEGEEVLQEDTIFLEDFETEIFLQESHNVRIIFEDSKASVFLDYILVAENITLESSYIGGIGLWVTRSEYHAWYDNIIVTNHMGEIVYTEDFEESENIFSPYYMKIEEGRGKTDAGYLMTPGMEVPAPMFRKAFTTEEGKGISSVRAYVTALGIYDFYINDRDVNNYYGAPGQSVYSKEVYYRTYDLTDHMNHGENVIGIILGHGRYDRAKGNWGEDLSVCMELVIHYTDGTKQVIGTDDSWWVCTDGPVRRDDFYHGELYDSRYQQEDWLLYDFVEKKHKGWEKASYLTREEDLLIQNNLLIKNGTSEGNGILSEKSSVTGDIGLMDGMPARKAALDNGIKCVEEISPVAMSEPAEGVFVYDFGKNINGICRINMSGHENDVAVMRYAEVLNKEELDRQDDIIGSIWTRNLGTAENTDYYIFSEDGVVTYEPKLIYRGFRYLQLTGIEKAPAMDEIQALILTSVNERTGTFECSDENMNRLYDAIYLSQLNNYVDIPTDCPQRDERLGWAGDAQVYGRTGSFNAYTASFMYKYIDALRISQDSKGAYPHIAPFYENTDAANGWSDAGIILVWEMYQQYGNKEIIMKNLTAMCDYMDHLVETSQDFIRNIPGYNDHNGTSYMEDAYCNTAQCAYVAGILGKMCEIAEKEEEKLKYNEIYEKYLAAFRSSFIGEDGSIGQWLPSEYVLALAYGLYPGELEEAGAEKLIIALEAGEYRASTGYITTPHILSVLCKFGYIEEAYKLIMQKEFPSWNYMLEKGNGTLMEGWNAYSQKEDGKAVINGSLNHVALGSVGQWFYTDVLGIKRDENNPGYKHFYLEPQVGGGLTYARGSYNSIYGKIESSWEVKDGKTYFAFVIPANTSATVTLPGGEITDYYLESGRYEFVVG